MIEFGSRGLLNGKPAPNGPAVSVVSVNCTRLTIRSNFSKGKSCIQANVCDCHLRGAVRRLASKIRYTTSFLDQTYEECHTQWVVGTQQEEDRQGREHRKPVVALAVDSSVVEAEDSFVDRSSEAAWARVAEGRLERCLAVRLQLTLVL